MALFPQTVALLICKYNRCIERIKLILLIRISQNHNQYSRCEKKFSEDHAAHTVNAPGIPVCQFENHWYV